MLRILCDDDKLMPVRAHKRDAGLDLRAADNYRLIPGEVTKVSTGIKIEIPKGYAGFIYPRSGLATKHGIVLANTVGIVDSDYRGEIICALNTRHVYDIQKYDRIAQLIIQPVYLMNPQMSATLSETDRGEGGFGHTGKY